MNNKEREQFSSKITVQYALKSCSKNFRHRRLKMRRQYTLEIALPQSVSLHIYSRHF